MTDHSDRFIDPDYQITGLRRAAFEKAVRKILESREAEGDPIDPYIASKALAMALYAMLDEVANDIVDYAFGNARASLGFDDWVRYYAEKAAKERRS